MGRVKVVKLVVDSFGSFLGDGKRMYYTER